MSVFDIKKWLHTYERSILDIPEGAFAIGRITNMINREVCEPNRNSTFSQILQEMQKMHDKKNHDYAEDGNPYDNFEKSAKFAGISVEQSFAQLCGTKDARTTQLMSGKEPKNESMDDTLLDRAIYTVLWLAYRRDQRSKNQMSQGIMGQGGLSSGSGISGR